MTRCLSSEGIPDQGSQVYRPRKEMYGRVSGANEISWTLGGDADLVKIRYTKLKSLNILTHTLDHLCAKRMPSSAKKS